MHYVRRKSQEKDKKRSLFVKVYAINERVGISEYLSIMGNSQAGVVNSQ